MKKSFVGLLLVVLLGAGCTNNRISFDKNTSLPSTSTVTLPVDKVSNQPAKTQQQTNEQEDYNNYTYKVDLNERLNGYAFYAVSKKDTKVKKKLADLIVSTLRFTK